MLYKETMWAIIELKITLTISNCRFYALTINHWYNLVALFSLGFS